jgi:hypothetical protein
LKTVLNLNERILYLGLLEEMALSMMISSCSIFLFDVDGTHRADTHSEFGRTTLQKLNLKIIKLNASKERPQRNSFTKYKKN